MTAEERKGFFQQDSKSFLDIFNQTSNAKTMSELIAGLPSELIFNLVSQIPNSEKRIEIIFFMDESILNELQLTRVQQIKLFGDTLLDKLRVTSSDSREKKRKEPAHELSSRPANAASKKQKPTFPKKGEGEESADFILRFLKAAKKIYQPWEKFCHESPDFVQATRDEKFKEIHFLAAIGSNEDLANFIKLKNPDLNKATKSGWTPLILAIENNEQAIIQKLIGEDVSVTSNPGTWSPMHSAALKNDTEIFQLLADRRAPTDAEGGQGIRPIHVAAENNACLIINYFANRGLDINQTDHHGQTPLHFAVDSKSEEALAALIGGGADFNLRTTSSKYPSLTPLETCAELTNTFRKKNKVRKADKMLEIFILLGGLIKEKENGYKEIRQAINQLTHPKDIAEANSILHKRGA